MLSAEVVCFGPAIKHRVHLIKDLMSLCTAANASLY